MHILANASPKIRFGLYKFNGDNGGTRLAALGTSIATITNAVNNIHAESWTPLGESMEDILDYYKTPGVIQYECQKNFVVVATDGFPTQDINVSSYLTDGVPASCSQLGAPNPNSDNCSDYMVDVARYMHDNDLIADNVMDGDQYVVTYCVGMNIDAPVLAQTAAAGDGAYFSANNAAEIAESLDRVLRDIVSRISAGSAVAVVSTEGEAEDQLYRSKFTPSDWKGYLEAFQLPYQDGEAPAWEAGQLLADRTPSTRTIFTSVNGQKVDFTTTYASTLRPSMGVASDAIATNVINWTRGETVAGYRDREGWLLGDIIDSSPVPVGAPSSFYMQNSYVAFRDALEDREPVLYVGANDGMVHCFSSETGEELWAYIPHDQLDHLDELADPGYCHEYSVNLSPKAFDCYLGGEWKTVLLGGERQGGAAYFALDVTDPLNPEFLWENNLSQVIESWSLPEVVRMKSDGRFLAFVGSGYDASGQANLIGFDMADGSSVWSTTLSDINTTNMATSCTAVDLEFDGYDDLLYVADMVGHLWRVDLTGNNPSTSLLFQTPGQPISAQPVVTVDYDNSVFIYFGTGKYLDPADMSDTSDQNFYCVIDNHSGQTLDQGDLVDQTDAVNNVAGARGWYFDLNVFDGERVTEPVALVAGIVYFISFAPNDEPCKAGGTSWLYAVKFRNGAVHDGDDDDSNDTVGTRSTEIGDGPAARPVIDIANEKVLVQGADTRIHISDALGEIKPLIVRSYRQQY